MPGFLPIENGRAATGLAQLENGFGFTYKGGTVALLGIRDHTLTMREQAVSCGGVNHTLVVDADVSTNQTRIEAPVLLVTPGAAVNLTFPEATSLTNYVGWVRNVGSHALILKDAAAATIAIVGVGQTAMVFCDGTTLRANVTGLAVAPLFMLPDDTAVAGRFQEGANPYLTFVTTNSGEKITIDVSLDQNGTIDQDLALIAAATMTDMAFTQTLATGTTIGLNVHATQLTNKRTAGSLIGVKIDMTGVAADDASGVYDALSLTADKAGALASVMTGIRFDAGWDAIMDLSAMATGEADVVLGANLAEAITFRTSAVSLLTLVTTTGALEATLAGLFNQDYARTTAGALLDAKLTVSHASNDMDVAYFGNIHDTARTGISVVNGVRVVLDSDAADDGTVEYTAFKAETDGTDGFHAAFKAGAGFDAALDLTGINTGEGVVALKDNLADAFTVSQGTNQYIKVRTTDANERIVLGTAPSATAVQASLQMASIGGIDFAGTDFAGRYVLEEQFSKRAYLTADVVPGVATDLLCNADFETIGTNATSALCTFAADGGILLTTAGAADDQETIKPHTIANMTSWAGPWLPSQQPRWKCNLQTSPGALTVASARFAAGLKLTIPAGVTQLQDATDADQVFFGYSTDGQYTASSANWVACIRIGGASANVDTGVAVVAGTNYKLVIDIDAAGVARFYINGALVAASAALTAGAALIPFAGVQTLAAAAAAKCIAVRRMAISRVLA